MSSALIEKRNDVKERELCIVKRRGCGVRVEGRGGI